MSAYDIGNGCGSCEELTPQMPMMQQYDQTTQNLTNSLSGSNNQAYVTNLVNNAINQAGVNTPSSQTMLNATNDGHQNVQPQQPSKPPARTASVVRSTGVVASNGGKIKAHLLVVLCV